MFNSDLLNCVWKLEDPKTYIAAEFQNDIPVTKF